MADETKNEGAEVEGHAFEDQPEPDVEGHAFEDQPEPDVEGHLFEDDAQVEDGV